MIYGNLRSLYSPAGKEYVTRWNPMARALAGSPLTQSQDANENPFGSGKSSGAGSQSDGGGRDGNNESPREGGAPRGGSMGSPFDGWSGGRVGGTIGTGLGLATGLGGLGLVGNAIGTGIDVAEANRSIGNTPNSIGLGGFASGMLNNATFGALGQSIGSQWGNALNAQSPYGMNDPQAGYDTGLADPFGPGGMLADPYGGIDPNAGAAGGVGGPSGGGEPGSSVGSDVGGRSGEVSGEGAPGGYAKGGHVTYNRLMGPNPQGPDDGYAALDAGEFVLRAKAAEKLGPDLLEKLNSGNYRKAALIKALSGK